MFHDAYIFVEMDLSAVLGMSSFNEINLDELKMGPEDVTFLVSNTSVFHEIRP